MNFSEIYSEIIQNRENHQQGYFNCIPFMGMERLERYLPGIEMSSYYLIGANSGIGKSKLSRFLFIHNPLVYIESNPDKDIKLDILYFSLEESKEKIIKSEICKYLFTKYNLEISIKQLSSVGRYNTITEDTLLKIKEAEEYVNKFLSKVKIFDSIRNPSGIYKTVRDFAVEVGTYYDKNNKPLSSTEMQNIKNSIGEDYKKVAYYKKHHNKHYVIVIIDHLSLLQPELGETLWQTMGKMSSKYCLHFRDKFEFTPVVVQQFSSDKEKIETNFQGKTIEEKLEPSIEAFGDNKTTVRDANIVLGLFGPDRYRLSEHNGYDITFFRDRYRSLSLLKSRDGVANKKLPLFFNGAVDFFKELPKTDDIEGMRRVYEYINELNRLN
jgi:hypothetical protein